MSPEQIQFEAPQGVTEIEVSHGFAQVQFRLERNALATARLSVLKLLSDEGVSHKYLQLTPDGLAMVVKDQQVQKVKDVLAKFSFDYDMNEGRSIILVKAPGIWEKKGMVASIMEAAIDSGVEVDHVGDMHDRMYMVVRGEVAESTAAKFREQLLGGGS
jgi:aspartokinase